VSGPRPPAILVLEDGRTFHGEAYAHVGETFGEAVFTTGMTGYQETLTDPSYHRQVVIQTAPHIGNTGVNESDDESDRIWVAGYVVRDPARTASNWRATGGLEDRLVAEGVVGVSGVDTRALTRHLRERGAMRVGVSSVKRDPAALLERVLQSPPMLGADLSAEVTTPQPFVVDAEGERRFTVAALDLGIKRNVARRLAARGVTTHVLPASSTLDDLLAVAPDAVFFSPGPGDPATAEHPVALARDVMRRGMPLFGICFGSQILGRALGFDTYKLGYGHRGVNQPVLDRATGKVEITAHNHGFAVAVASAPGNGQFRGNSPYPGTGSGSFPTTAPSDDLVETEFGAVEVSHVCLNDGVVEGLRCRDVPAFTVQYHPEAAAGPHDADYLFDRFIELIDRREPAHA
jgi:carbamoyl-phosphate synthase small subunit